jgi:hypothetical protein
MNRIRTHYFSSDIIQLESVVVHSKPFQKYSWLFGSRELKKVFVFFPLRMQYYGARPKTGWYFCRIILYYFLISYLGYKFCPAKVDISKLLVFQRFSPKLMDQIWKRDL